MARIRFAVKMSVCLAFVVLAFVSPLAAQPAAKKPALERSPLLKEPTTPEEMFSAAILMVDLARFDLAAKYLEQFSNANPDNELVIKLRDKYGTGEFLKLAASKELQPAATTLLDQLNAITRKQAEDTAFVDGLIKRLIQGPTERDMAILELRNAGAGAVPEILKKMAEPEMAANQDDLVLSLVRMGKQVVPPLIGALDTPDDRIRAAVIDALGWLDAVEAIPYLWYPAFDENQSDGVRIAARRTIIKLQKGSPDRGTQLSSVAASNELKRIAKLFYRTPDLLPTNERDAVDLWAWDKQEGTVVPLSVSPEVASMFLSTRFASQSLALSPDQSEPQRQYLASLLGFEILRKGWDVPRVPNPGSAMYLGLTAGEEMMSQVLSDALEAGRPSTAVPALEILSQIGTREQLLSQRGLKSPVIAAINAPDPRVQFAAATTILKLNPKNGFSGSNRIVSVLARALTGTEQSKAIVIDSDNGRASTTSGYLSEGGFEGYVAATGRDGFEKATLSTGVEVIAVHVNCQRWDLTQTLSNLRADSRTASIPIVIYGPATLKAEMATVVARHRPATYVAESSTSSDFLDQVLPFMKTVKTPPLSPLERTQAKNAAAYWLATIGSGSLSKIFDISQAENELANAVEDPNIATNVLIALGGIGKGSAQRRLADVALNPQLEESVRQTASNQLAYHIQQYGLMLTKDEVINLHSGWKSTANPVVKSALASVIGSLKPNATIIGERLRQFPTPAAN
jgi:hypothetical protein